MPLYELLAEICTTNFGRSLRFLLVFKNFSLPCVQYTNDDDDANTKKINQK